MIVTDLLVMEEVLVVVAVVEPVLKVLVVVCLLVEEEEEEVEVEEEVEGDRVVVVEDNNFVFSFVKYWKALILLRPALGACAIFLSRSAVVRVVVVVVVEVVEVMLVVLSVSEALSFWFIKFLNLVNLKILLKLLLRRKLTGSTIGSTWDVVVGYEALLRSEALLISLFKEGMEEYNKVVVSVLLDKLAAPKELKVLFKTINVSKEIFDSLKIFFIFPLLVVEGLVERVLVLVVVVVVVMVVTVVETEEEMYGVLVSVVVGVQ